MPFEKGKQKTGGRKKGSSNKSTQQLREIISKFFGNKIEELEELFDQLTPKEKLDYLIKLSDFVLPKLDKVSLDENQDKELKIKIIYPDSPEK